MLRDYLPIPLIPAAWILTLTTMVYPGIDTYWIQHMNLFITVFLGVFGALSWKKMGDDEVLKDWRNVIALGFICTGLGTLPFYFQSAPDFLASVSVDYWFLVPAYGFKLTAERVDQYSEEYRWLAYMSVPAFLGFLIGTELGNSFWTAFGIILVAKLQTASILYASKMDKDWEII